ncbi:hypothetical protein Cgig2_011728 [Carnegiea gigantea]|uniref:Fe-S metabolism associated domain-containing protein n=1 Tax=Carnegiea gigantea TaxID=171969 RepID=A0A9Q1QKB9_9CARY|nr:hypothetical protein Cgig2_011728 [Carnegiea gigantea]
MSAMSIPSSIRAIKTRLPNFNLFSSSPKLVIPPLPCPSFLRFSSLKSITFQRIPTKPQSLSSPSPSLSSSSSLQPIEELPPKLQEIIRLFQAAQDPRAKYQQLMFYANNLPLLDDKYKTKENKVEGCVSQVWVRAYLDPQKNVYYEADSDSIMTKGLAALLVQGLSGRPVSEILQVSPDFVTLLGLQQNLTPSRNNGFLNMLKLMQRKALILGLEAEKQAETSRSEMGTPNLEPEAEINGVNGSSVVERLDLDVGRSESEGNGSVSSSGGSAGGLGKRGERIREKLERELKPVELEIEDVSHQHAGHMVARGSNGETHFNLKIVSNEFEGKSLVKRHRMIYGLLQDELQSGLHALSIIAKTPSEVEEGRLFLDSIMFVLGSSSNDRVMTSLLSYGKSIAPSYELCYMDLGMGCRARSLDKDPPRIPCPIHRVSCLTRVQRGKNGECRIWWQINQTGYQVNHFQPYFSWPLTERLQGLSCNQPITKVELHIQFALMIWKGEWEELVYCVEDVEKEAHCKVLIDGDELVIVLISRTDGSDLSEHIPGLYFFPVGREAVQREAKML